MLAIIRLTLMNFQTSDKRAFLAAFTAILSMQAIPATAQQLGGPIGDLQAQVIILQGQIASLQNQVSALQGQAQGFNGSVTGGGLAVEASGEHGINFDLTYTIPATSDTPGRTETITNSESFSAFSQRGAVEVKTHRSEIKNYVQSELFTLTVSLNFQNGVIVSGSVGGTSVTGMQLLTPSQTVGMASLLAVPAMYHGGLPASDSKFFCLALVQRYPHQCKMRELSTRSSLQVLGQAGL
jgi:hypothetical protein